jgi:hypothetical protein
MLRATRWAGRRGTLAFAGGLLGLAALAAGAARGADERPAPRPVDGPGGRGARPQVPQQLEEWMRQGGGLRPEEVNRLLEGILADPEMRALVQERERILRDLEGILGGPGLSVQRPNLPEFRGGAILPPAAPNPPRPEPDPRLGARVATPNATLVEQLELPKGHGVVLEEVPPGSAAARAGLKAHDILLELDGKPVPSDRAEFARFLAALAADKPVPATVLRRGRRETVAGLRLAEGRAARPAPRLNGRPAAPTAPPTPPGDAGPDGAGDGGGARTSIFRSNDRFATQHKDGALTITLTGTIADGRATVSEIRVQDGAVGRTYARVDEVPEAYRGRVRGLVRQAERGAAGPDTRTP